jgi:hypothetical protein
VIHSDGFKVRLRHPEQAQTEPAPHSLVVRREFGKGLVGMVSTYLREAVAWLRNRRQSLRHWAQSFGLPNMSVL